MESTHILCIHLQNYVICREIIFNSSITSTLTLKPEMSTSHSIEICHSDLVQE